MNKKYLKIITAVCLLGWLAFFLFQQLDLVTVDLGRFIRNGEYLLSGDWRAVLQTNFYSYTYSDFPFLNHHWATGAVFYLFHQMGGFLFLHLLAVALIFAAFLLLFKIAKKEAGLVVATILSLLLIPLMAYRKEIRPEIFSCLFSATFFYILWAYRNKGISTYWLWVLPALEILWVNLHIYFFLGPAIIGAFLLEKILLFLKNRQESLKKIISVFVLCVLASLFNPFVWKGALYPFDIRSNYGYRVLEEQSVWFLQNLNIHNPSFILFQIVLGLFVLSFVWIAIKRRKEFPLVNFFLISGFGFMACWSVRNITLFGFFALPILAKNIKIIFQHRQSQQFQPGEVQPPQVEKMGNFSRTGKKLLWAGLMFVIVITICGGYWKHLSIRNDSFGLGLASGTNNAAVFFEENKLQGPIFNNYDIGAYLIYHLFPEEKVFTDNRPETYPAKFFQDIYISMQENEDVWREKNEEYGFNAIVFYFRDATPWGQKFLIARVQDDAWAPVFAENSVIIFLKRNDLNKIVIEKYEIPKEMFQIIPQ